MELKPGVELTGRHFDPEVRVQIDVARDTAPPLIGDSLVVTSANDGQHAPGSLHYLSQAFDFRCRASDPGLRGCIRATDLTELRAKARRWVADMRRKLGRDYDVLLEEGVWRDAHGRPHAVLHIHSEFDP